MSSSKTITIRKRLDSETVQLGEDATPLLGREVEIIVRQIPKPKPKSSKKNWPSLGIISLSGKADELNIRDLAHND